MRYGEYINWSDYHYLLGKLTEFEDQGYEFILDVFVVDKSGHSFHVTRYSTNKEVRLEFETPKSFLNPKEFKNVRYEVFDYGGLFSFKWLDNKVKHKFKEYEYKYQTGGRIYLEPI